MMSFLIFYIIINLIDLAVTVCKRPISILSDKWVVWKIPPFFIGRPYGTRTNGRTLWVRRLKPTANISGVPMALRLLKTI